MIGTSTARCLVFGLLMSLLGVAGLSAAEPAQKSTSNWAYWRGPSYQGYSDDTKVPLVWSDTKNLLWKKKLPGFGNSTPIIWGQRVFLTAATRNGDERVVICLRKTDGEILWTRTAAKGVKPGKTHPWNGYASASCATDGERVYAFFGTPGLFCYDMDGNFKWKHDFGTFTSERGWGTAASPFIYNDLVIQNCDNDGVDALPRGEKTKKVAPMALVAFDKVKGTVKWERPRNQGRGFSTPRLNTTPKGRLEMLLNSPRGLWAYDPKTGKEIWHCDRDGEQARFGEPIPIVKDEMIYAPSGRGGPFQAIKMDGSGDITKTHVVWEKERTGHRDVGSQILWDSRIYAVDTKGVITCYDIKDGKVLYNKRISGSGKALGSPVALRGKILFILDNGETVVIEPGPELKIVGRNKLGDGKQLDFGASPAISDGKLYLRSQMYLYCVGDKK